MRFPPLPRAKHAREDREGQILLNILFQQLSRDPLASLVRLLLDAPLRPDKLWRRHEKYASRSAARPFRPASFHRLATLGYRDTGGPASYDAIVTAPDNHKVVFENEKVRVLEVTIKPGEKEPHFTSIPCSA